MGLSLTKQRLEGLELAVFLAISLHYRPIEVLSLLQLLYKLVPFPLHLSGLQRLSLELLAERLHLHLEPARRLLRRSVALISRLQLEDKMLCARKSLSLGMMHLVNERLVTFLQATDLLPCLLQMLFLRLHAYMFCAEGVEHTNLLSAHSQRAFEARWRRPATRTAARTPRARARQAMAGLLFAACLVLGHHAKRRTKARGAANSDDQVIRANTVILGVQRKQTATDEARAAARDCPALKSHPPPLLARPFLLGAAQMTRDKPFTIQWASARRGRAPHASAPCVRSHAHAATSWTARNSEFSECCARAEAATCSGTRNQIVPTTAGAKMHPEGHADLALKQQHLLAVLLQQRVLLVPRLWGCRVRRRSHVLLPLPVRPRLLDSMVILPAWP